MSRNSGRPGSGSRHKGVTKWRDANKRIAAGALDRGIRFQERRKAKGILLRNGVPTASLEEALEGLENGDSMSAVVARFTTRGRRQTQR
ncbi:MAG: hypothetical protein HY394_00720 [Candidatus Diapherotrites archaeon]|nr:hypothetical protein [Candidatus Diapherotrites archaeon]